MKNCFNAFDEISSSSSFNKTDYAMRLIYDYEAHYLQLIKKRIPSVNLLWSLHWNPFYYIFDNLKD